MSASTPSTPALMPRDLRAHGRSRRLWRSVIAGDVLRADAVETLGDACRIADQLDELRDVIADDGMMITSGGQGPRIHPGVIEALSRQSFRRHLSQLGA
ncbi:MAG: hypothetical protein ACR2QO_05915 [Acidimicrobiales bacterium]